MAKLLISYSPFEIRVGLLEDDTLVEYAVERPKDKGVVGNIYKGRVVRVVPGINSAFIDIGLERTAFLFSEDVFPKGEILWDKGEPAPPSPLKSLREGQEILVQVVKEPLGTKGARLTTNLTIPGHYLVYLPLLDRIGVSRKIKDEAERARLKELVQNLRPPNSGWIIRTAAEGADEEVLKEEMEFLLCLWENIKEKAKRAKAPALVYEELNIAFRAIRDLFNRDVSLILVDDAEFFKELQDFLGKYYPRLFEYLKLYEGSEDIFYAHGVNIDVKKLLSRKVWLKSGGFIIIEPCETLTAIDVNTGRFTGDKDLEDTVFKINLEAAQEIARELRLRNIGGLVVIDFIDMDLEEHKEKVVETLINALRKDKAKYSYLPISSLGLLEMTRERRRDSLYELFLEPCPLCHGEGKIKSKRTVYYELLRRLYRIGKHLKNKTVIIEISPYISEVVSEEINFLEEIEKKFAFKSQLKINRELNPWEYKFHIQ
ncbi:MAG: Rne/Rng family ribonuclease [Thermodesulfobacterium sp.]|nr:Rne/Rng family ribonuclease [Thermodesulfobacterium sp.]